ncbi:OmpA family protein [Enhygromyxa salina]|uniref:Outer membrane porin F n=1 Tax=Enhygromyxa salina TaxID=215803 RepID=A0A2S9YNC4_9BACT|nr:OmpA family protein [Enhygromyxa salina]PRQ06586.1 Outer membrane porin F precursor [Enhygromyxa salina]
MRTIASSVHLTPSFRPLRGLTLVTLSVLLLAGCKPKHDAVAPEPLTAAITDSLEAEAGPTRVELRDDRIVIHEKIQFDLNRATIKPASDSLLREIAALIQANPQLEQVSIEGHTCNIGSPEYNLDLSQRRATAVRKRLVREGVASSRLAARGYGLTAPLASNSDEVGRETNRRVEFRVVSQVTIARKVEVDAEGREKVIEERQDTVRDDPAPAPTYKKRKA